MGATSDDASLMRALGTLVQARTWYDAREIVQEHPELLTDRADYFLDIMVQEIHPDGEDPDVFLLSIQRFLRRSREVGVQTACREEMSR